MASRCVNSFVDTPQLPEFIHKTVAPNVTLVREAFFVSDNLANIWVVRGSERCLVIDAGLGLWDLRGYLEASGLLTTTTGAAAEPILVLTHVHFDHSGGAHQFQDVWIHEAEGPALSSQSGSLETVTFLKPKHELTQLPPGWKDYNTEYSVVPVTPNHLLHNNDLISLGPDCQLQVFHTPGHSRGSIVLFDESRGYLFTGDTVYNGSMLDWLPASNIPDYVATCHLLLGLSTSVAQVFPGHHSAFERETLMRLLQNYLSIAPGFCYQTKTNFARFLTHLYLVARNRKYLLSIFLNICCCCICWRTCLE